MFNKLAEKFEDHPYKSSFIVGAVLNLAFPPIFFFPALVCIGILIFIINKQDNAFEAFKVGWLFGFGFYLFNLYWITVGVSIYIDKFWWALPFALVVLPIFLAFYKAIVAVFFYYIRNFNYNITSFASIWVILEITRAKLFTGFPWSLMAYSFSFSDIVIQITSIIGSYGLSLIIVWSFGVFCFLLEQRYRKFFVNLVPIAAVWSFIIVFGTGNLDANPTTYTDLKLRLVQPSIKQKDKWSLEEFWNNFYTHKYLSTSNLDKFNPDIIIWPESAVTLEPTYLQVNKALTSVVADSESMLITGGVTNNFRNPNRKRYKVHVSIYAVNEDGNIIFDYHKSHLVPFGEYVPFGLPINKITPGIFSFTPGKPGFVVKIENYDLKIRPLLCYEIIFPDEVRMSNTSADAIFNLTNDAYYGNTSGPYQHFYTARMRAVENGLPLVRVANNGITAIFDSVGRILKRSELNDIGYIDAYLPEKLENATIYSQFGNKYVYLFTLSFIILSLILPRFTKLLK